ncbi:MAG: RCC1 domain-containing protein, partial [Bacteroidota bacterium]
TGDVQCWGDNRFGQIGDGTRGEWADKLEAVRVGGLTAGVTQIAAGFYHTCALLNTGGVKCWGNNTYGQLGDGTGTDRVTPVDVTSLTSGVIQITARNLHTCALLVSGAVRCWGWNDYGQIGDGTSGANRLSPVDVVGLTSEVVQIGAGEIHTCALLNSGDLQCWGYNGSGQLGDQTNTMRLSPVNVLGLSSEVTEITAGYAHTCALLGTDGVKCWGNNDDGQLGDGTYGTNRLVPVGVSGLNSGVTRIAVGFGHSCAVLSSEEMKCWGANGSGQIGDGTEGVIDKLIPVTVLQ